MGLELKFYRQEDGSVFVDFFADPKFEGYSRIIHRGIVFTMLDSAMTHCLLMENILALTGRLSIKHSTSIQTGSTVKLGVRIVDQAHKMFVLEGMALADGRRFQTQRPNIGA